MSVGTEQQKVGVFLFGLFENNLDSVAVYNRERGFYALLAECLCDALQRLEVLL